MKINEHTALSTPSLLLVPYSAHHVPTYHTWMQDPDLQAATASEPLTLPEEYEMQRSWRTDHDKLTFIVCLPLESSYGDMAVRSGLHDAPERMIGDINLFLFDPEEDDEDDHDNAVRADGVVGEIELMIARKDLQRKGYGRASLLAFLEYVLDSWEAISAEYGQGSNEKKPLSYLRVRINQTNERSITLFRSVGFEMAKEANYFGEVEMRWRPDREALRRCKGWEEVGWLGYLEPAA